MIGTFGATYKPYDQLKYVKEMYTKTGISYNGVRWRSGGLYQLFKDREVTWGNNVVTQGSNGANTTPDTFGQKFGHIIQVRQQVRSNASKRILGTVLAFCVWNKNL